MVPNSTPFISYNLLFSVYPIVSVATPVNAWIWRQKSWIDISTILKNPNCAKKKSKLEYK